MKYDLVIIGSGPGGYVAAIRASQLGIKTAIIEKYPKLGGTCLNVGCIPSKALLDSSEHFYHALHSFKFHGIEIKSMKVNFPDMIKRKNDLVADINNGVKYLMSKNKIDIFYGHGAFVDQNSIEITKEDGAKTRIETSKTIIATGSKPATIPGVSIDKKKVITSTEALSLKKIPGEILIIGGGAIGLELGSIYARLGSKVKVLEFMDSIICNMDKTLGKELQKLLNKQGIEFYLSHKVKKVVVKGKKVNLIAENNEGQQVKFSGDYCLVAVGRRPYTHKLGLENAGIATDEKGQIKVNSNLESSNPNIFAIGDVIGGAMLAHKAEEEGTFVAERIAGQKPQIEYLTIPNVVYTSPEVAGVGYTEQDVQNSARDYKIGSFPFKALGRARAANETDGLIKVIADKKTDEILGVHMIGARVADLIAEAVVALEYRASAEDIARISHAHPSFAEAMREACLAATENRAIHI